jgi:hypothetical protein
LIFGASAFRFKLKGAYHRGGKGKYFITMISKKLA